MKKINWRLISDWAIILGIISILIGITFMANKLKEYEDRIVRLEIKYRIVEQDLIDNYEIDPGIKKVD